VSRGLARTFASVRTHWNHRLSFFPFLGGAPLGGLFAGRLVDVGGTALAFSVAGLAAVATSPACLVTLLTTSPARRMSSSPMSW
jgi:hypothetical protein